MVIKHAKLQGVVGIHFDECQHVFTEDGGRTNQQILDSFKALLKDSRWPLMLILSGIPSLAKYVAVEEQLARLLRTVRFRDIDLSQKIDMEELLNLAYSYAESAGLDFSPLSNVDFLERLAFACCNRWGLVIEMLIEAFTRAKVLDEEVWSKAHFSYAFAKGYSTPIGYSPFTMPNYQDSFDQARLIEVFERT
jgi:hypothetical protein